MGDETGRPRFGTRFGRQEQPPSDVEGELNRRLTDVESRETKLQAMLAIERKRVHDERQKSEAKEEEISQLLEELSMSNQEGLEVQRRLDEADFKLHISETHRQDLVETLSESLEANRRILEAAFGEDVTSRGDVGVGLAVIDEARNSGSHRRVVVDGLADGGPAVVSGKVRIGDTITTIRGLDTSQLRVDEMHRLMEGPHGTPVTITGTRGRSLVNFAVTLVRSNGTFALSDQNEKVCAQISRTQRDLQRKKAVLFFERQARDIVAPWRIWTNNKKRIRAAGMHVTGKRGNGLMSFAFDALKDQTQSSKVLLRGMASVGFRFAVRVGRVFFKQWQQYKSRKHSLRRLERILRQQHEARYTRSVISWVVRGWIGICHSRERLQFTQMFISKRARKAKLFSILTDWARARRKGQQLSRLAALLSGTIHRLWLLAAFRHWRGAQSRKKHLSSTFDQIGDSRLKNSIHSAFSAWIAVVYEKNRAMSLSAIIARGANTRRLRVVLRSWAGMTQIVAHCAWQALDTAVAGWMEVILEARQLMKLYSIMSRIANRHRYQVALRCWAAASAGISQMRTGMSTIACKEEESVRKTSFEIWRSNSKTARRWRAGSTALADRRRYKTIANGLEEWAAVVRIDVRKQRVSQRMGLTHRRKALSLAFDGWMDARAARRRRRRLCEAMQRSGRLAALAQSCQRWTDCVARQRQHRASCAKGGARARRRTLAALFAEWDGSSRRTRQLLRITDTLLRAERWFWTGRVLAGWAEWQQMQGSLRRRSAAAFKATRRHGLTRAVHLWAAIAGRARQLARSGALVAKLSAHGRLQEMVGRWQCALEHKWQERRGEKSFSRAERRLWVRAFVAWRAVTNENARGMTLSASLARGVDHRVLGGLMKEWVAAWMQRKHLRLVEHRLRLWTQGLCTATQFSAWIEARSKARHLQTIARRLTSWVHREVATKHLALWTGSWMEGRHLRRTGARLTLWKDGRDMAMRFSEWYIGAKAEARLRRVLRGLERTVRRQRIARALKVWFAVFTRTSYLGWACASIVKLQGKRTMSAAHAGWQEHMTERRKMQRVASMLLAAATKHWVSQAFRWWLTLWRRADRQRLSAASVALFRDSESKAAARTFRAWLAVSQREEQLHWSYSASCRAVRKSAAASAFAEWAATARLCRMRSRRHARLAAVTARHLLQHALHWWAGGSMEARSLGWAHRTLQKGFRRRRLQRVLKEWMVIGMRGERRMLAHALSTLGTAHLRRCKLSALREWAALSRIATQLRRLDEELAAERRTTQLSGAVRGWVGVARTRRLLQWAYSGACVRWSRFWQGQVVLQWCAEARRQRQVTVMFSQLVHRVRQRWATTTLTRILVVLAGGMDTAAANAAARAQVVAHQTSAMLHSCSLKRLRKVWGRWAAGTVELKERRDRERVLARMALRRREGAALSAWRELLRESKDMALLAAQAARCRWQATVARWLFGWIGVVKRSREVMDVGATLAGRQLMAMMAGAFLRWRKFALWEAFDGGEAVDETLGDAVWECVGDRVRPSDAHEWAAKALWGVDGGGAEALCASDLVMKVKVGVAKTVGRWFGSELLSALVRLHRTEDTLMELGTGLMALKAEHGREVEQMANRLMELESVLLALLSSSDLSTDPALGLSPSLSRFRSPPPPVPGASRGYDFLSPVDRISDSMDDFSSRSSDKGVGIGVLLDKVAGAEDVIVKGLVPGGLAGRTGLIRHNDVLEAINGERVRGLGLGAIYRRMQGREGSPLFLQLARRGCSHLLNAPVRFQVSFVRSAAPPPSVIVGAA